MASSQDLWQSGNRHILEYLKMIQNKVFDLSLGSYPVVQYIFYEHFIPQG